MIVERPSVRLSVYPSVVGHECIVARRQAVGEYVYVLNLGMQHQRSSARGTF